MCNMQKRSHNIYIYIYKVWIEFCCILNGTGRGKVREMAGEWYILKEKSISQAMMYRYVHESVGEFSLIIPA